ncbi:MAG: hotdog domain-containing protein [Thermodesulfobacteriota bacterium]
MNYIQSYYPLEDSTCFGCGYSNPLGMHVKSYWQDHEAVCRYTPGPEQTAFGSEVVYGGLLACLVDCHSVATAIAAAYAAEGRPLGTRPIIAYVTGNLNVRYLAPTPLGPELLLRAWVTEVHPKKALVACELSAEGKVTVKGETVAVRARWAA